MIIYISSISNILKKKKINKGKELLKEKENFSKNKNNPVETNPNKDTNIRNNIDQKINLNNNINTNTNPKFKTFEEFSNQLNNLNIENIKKILGFITINLDKDKNRELKRKAARKIIDPVTLKKIENLPKNFITTDKWPNCGSYVKSQGYCASCWAFSASEVLQDRYCIKKGFQVPEFSVQELISCDYDNFNCEGGDLKQVWEYLESKGTVTEECFPYGNKNGGKLKRCTKTCDNGKAKSYIMSKYYKTFDTSNSDEIKLEIYENGPIMTGFEVYWDFLTYKSGIYTKSEDSEFLGGHAVKIIGWGEENGIKFWVAKNSWGYSWGENGFFRFKMDSCCQFEENCITGYAV